MVEVIFSIALLPKWQSGPHQQQCNDFTSGDVKEVTGLHCWLRLCFLLLNPSAGQLIAMVGRDMKWRNPHPGGGLATCSLQGAGSYL